MDLEKVYYRLIGVRKEFPQINPFAAAFMETATIFHIIKHRCIVEGYPLPREGAAIVTGNHYSQSDSYLGVLAARKSGRLIRAVVKKILIEKGAYESEEYLKSIGDKKDSAEYSPLKAFTLRGIGWIGILRDNPGVDFIRTCHQVLDTNQLLGQFLQSTRDEEGLLRNLQPGVAFLASREKYQDVPVYPIAFSDHRATVLKPFTYNQLKNQLGRELGIEEMTIIIADKISPALPNQVQKDWQNRKKSEFLRLTASKK